MTTFNGSERMENGMEAARENPWHGRILKYPAMKRNVWAVGGGKGGVGKSLIASNLSVMLSKRDFKVLMIDADLGAPNLHTFMGMNGPRHALSEYLTGASTDFGRLVSKTPVPNLDIISAAREPLDSADLKKGCVQRLKDGLKTVDHDYIIMDLAPGTSALVIELFNMADSGIVVTTPEPTSVENTYRFLKCVFLGKMKRIMNQAENKRTKALIQEVFRASWADRIKSFGDILKALKALDPGQAAYLKEAIEHAGVSILVNRTRGVEDEGLPSLIKRGARDYFNLEIGSLGFIRDDGLVGDSVLKKSPLALREEGSEAARCMQSCLDWLLDARKRKIGT